MPPGKTVKTNNRSSQRDHRKVRKEITNIERKITRLDEHKRQLNGQLLQATDPEEALRLHNEVAAITTELNETEERWCELQEDVTQTNRTNGGA